MEKIKNTKREKILFFLLLAITFIGAFGICCLIHYSDGDDAFFLEQIKEHPAFLDFVSYLTKTMNGRITSTVLLWFVFKLPLFFWRFVNAGVITATAFIASRIITAFRNDKEKVNNYIFSLSFFSVIGIGVIGYSCLWITGSVNYLWPACASLFAIYPVVECEYQKKAIKPFLFVLCTLAGLYVCLAQEQIAVVLMSFLAVIFVKSLVESKKLNVGYAVMLLVIVGATLVLLLSPFTDERTGREMRWLPEYATMSFAQKFFITWQWLIHSFTHSLRFVMLMLWCCLSIKLFVERKRILACLPALFSLICIIPVFFAKSLVDVGLNELDMTKTVEHAPKFADLSSMQFAMLLLWSALIIATVFILIYTLQGQRTAFANVLMYLAAFASCAIMLFSPSIYASGERTLFVAGILLILISSNLRREVDSPKQEVLFIGQIAIVSLLQLFNNADYLIKMIS